MPLTESNQSTSLWEATAPPAPESRALDTDVKADVCVVGGGYTGLSAALHLAEQGLSVRLLEAHGIGWGASGRNGGQINPQFRLDPSLLERRYGGERAARLIEFVGGGGDLVFDLIARHGIDCDARRSGWIQALHSDRVIGTAQRRRADWQRYGVALDWLDRGDVIQLTGSDAYVAGLLDPRAGRLQPLAYARGLARAATAAGAVLHTDSPARALRQSGSAWHVVTPNGTVTADAVIIGTNGYTDGLVPGLAQSILPIYSYQIATEPLSDNQVRSVLPEGHTMADSRRLLTYMRVEADGRIVLGGRGGFAESHARRDYRHLANRLDELFPQLQGTQWNHYWGGRIAITTDHMPHWHEVAPGVTAGLGYNGRGVAMATAMGKMLAEHCLGVSPADLSLPQTAVERVALHRLRRPIMVALRSWYGFRDRLDTRRFSG